MHTRRSRRLFLLVGSAAFLGCSEGPDDPTRYNRPLGDEVGLAPVGSGNIDMSILSDPANYTPAKYEPLSQARLPTPADSPEAAAIRQTINDFATALLDRDIEAVLDTMDPKKVAALRDGDFVDSAYELSDSLERLWTVLEEKSKDTDLAAVLQATALIRPLKDVTIASLTIEVGPDDTATIDIDPERLQAGLQSIRDQMVATFDNLLAVIPSDARTADTPASGEEAFNELVNELPQAMEMFKAQVQMQGAEQEPLVEKVEGKWRMAVAATVTPEQAETANEVLLALKSSIDNLTQQLQAQEKVGTQELAQILPMWGMMTLGQVASTWPELQSTLAQITGGAMPLPGAGGPQQAVSFSKNVVPLLASRCAECHQPGGRALRAGVSLDLRPAQAYAALVGKASDEADSKTLVIPKDVSASYVYEKVSSDTPAEGDRMPPLGDPLTDEELAMIRAWIEAGAPDN